MPYFEEILAKGKGLDAYYPESSYPTIGVGLNEKDAIRLDSAGNLAVRGPILTDEGSIRDSFAGTSLGKTMSGTLTFQNGSDQVVGDGTSFLSSGISTFHSDYIKLDSANILYWTSVVSIEDDTHLTLEKPYEGPNGTGTASYAKFKPAITGNGSITVADGNCTIASGTTNNTESAISKLVDYCPLIFTAYLSISQRINNVSGSIGLLDNVSSPENSAWFEVSGTDNKQLICKSALNTGIESTTISLPNGYTTEDKLKYRIELSLEYVQFCIEKVVVATHYNLIPDPYTMLNAHIGWKTETGAASSSSFVVDTIFIANANIVQVQGGFTGVPLMIDNPPPVNIKQTSASALNAYLIDITDVLDYKSVCVQISGTWVGRIEFQASVDRVNFLPVSSIQLDDNIFVKTVTDNGIYYIANSGFYYFRAKLIGYGSGTVYADMTLSSAVLPIPSSSPKMAVMDLQNNKELQITNNREMKVSPSLRLCGKLFSGSILDTNFWTSTIVSGGSTTVSGGHVQLKTNSGTTDSSTIRTVAVARFMASTSNVFKSIAKFATVGIANNTRRIGVFTSNSSDGFFFELAGTTFRIGVTNNNVTTTIATNFNGNLGSIYTLNTSYHTFEIIYNANSVEYYIDNYLLHKITITTSPLVSEMNLYALLSNTNSGAVAAASELDSIETTIARHGEMVSQPKVAYLGSSSTYTLKIGAGQINKLLINDNAGLLSIYDNTAASGTLLGIIDCSRIYSTLDLQMPFNIGITLVTSAGAKVTVMYE